MSLLKKGIKQGAILTTIIITLFFVLFTTEVHAATSEDGRFEYGVNSRYNCIQITKYLGDEENVIIPETIDGKTVGIIGETAFYNEQQLKSVSGNSIKQISGRAFGNCSNLSTINFPNATYIGTSHTNGIWLGAFEKCNSLINVELPSATMVSDCAFCGCSNLKTIYLPKLESIGTNSFNYDADGHDLPNIEKIYMPCAVVNYSAGYNIYSKDAFMPLHNVENWSVTDATCTIEGTKTGECLACHNSINETIPVNSSAHRYITYTYNNDAQVGIDGTETAVCENGCGTSDTRKKVGSALRGGNLQPSTPSLVPIIQKPTIETSEGVIVVLSKDGTSAVITVSEEYEVVDVLLNGVSVGKVTKVEKLKTGDKLTVQTISKTDLQKEAMKTAITETKLAAKSKLVTMKSGKKAIKITWYDKSENDVIFDGMEIFRSLKRNSGYGKKPYFVSVTDQYYNTAIKKGQKYYYKVRGFVIIDGEKYYTDWSLKAIRTA